MGKRLIIKGADFSNVAVSNEPILNPLSIIGIGQGGGWMDQYFPLPDGEYAYLVNVGKLYVGTGGSQRETTMPEGYDSLNFEGVIMNKPSGAIRYNVAYPNALEEISWGENNKAYVYDQSQSTEPTLQTANGMKAVKVRLNAGDVLVYNGEGGNSPRAIWVMKDDYSATIRVADAGTISTYAPVCYKATESCEVFLNATTGSKYGNCYVLRAS